MRVLLLLVFLGMTISSNAKWSAYYPDGRKITFQFSCIKDIIDSMHVTETESYDHKLGTVYFKRLTNKPLFIFFLENPHPEKIKEMIASYNYSKYLFSYSYYWDLKNMIDSGSLTKFYLLDAFGQPNSRLLNSDGDSTWLYSSFNSKIVFYKDGDIATNADVINYRAILKNKFSISNYQVTGSDYSIGFSLSVSNYWPKTIKYIYFTVTATNPVNDKVGTKTVKGVGPIEPSENGSYEFEDIIYSRTAQYLSLDLIKIQFMDGSIQIISKKDIDDVTKKDWEEIGNRTY